MLQIDDHHQKYFAVYHKSIMSFIWWFYFLEPTGYQLSLDKHVSESSCNKELSLKGDLSDDSRSKKEVAVTVI